MPTTSDTEKYFDENAGNLVAGNLIDKWSALDWLTESLVPGGELLECGAGTGLYTFRFVDMGLKVSSIDLSRMSLDQIDATASQRGVTDRVSTIQGEFCSTVGASSHQYDAVSFIKVLHHFAAAERITHGIQIAYDRLKPGGVIIGFEPNGLAPLWLLNLRLMRSAEGWENEKNYLLIRRNRFERIFRSLPGAKWQFRYRYFLPGSIVCRAPSLDRLDRTLCRIPVLNRVALNLLFRVRKPH